MYAGRSDARIGCFVGALPLEESAVVLAVKHDATPRAAARRALEDLNWREAEDEAF